MIEMTYSETRAKPHHGLETAVELKWDRRDMGGEFLVVERGSEWSSERLTNLWSATGRIVTTRKSKRAAESLARSLEAKAALRGYGALYTVVPRTAVEIVESDAPYGCLAGDLSA